MKKILLFVSAIFSLVLLTSCNKGTYNFTLGEYTVTRNAVTVNYSLDDPNKEVTSTFQVKISESGLNASKEVKSLSTSTATSVTFSSLTSGVKYDVCFFATYNKKNVVLSKFTFTTSTQGTEENPYQLTNDPIKFATMLKNDASGYFELTSDVDFANTSCESLFTSSTPFTGSFDGKGYKIKGFLFGTASTTNEITTYTCAHSANTYGGIFGYIGANGVVKNVEFENTVYYAQRSGKGYYGLIAGYCAGTIENVKVTNIAMNTELRSTSDSYHGILVGELAGNGVIKDCDITGNFKVVARSNLRCGGVAGIIDGDAKKCYISNVTCNILFTVSNTGSSSTWEKVITYAGGLVGDNQCTVKNSAFLGTINVTTKMNKSDSAKTYIVSVGGIAGASVSDASVISNSASKATIVVDSEDAMTVNVGATVGANGAVSPAYASMINTVSKALITVTTKADATLNVNGSTGIDNRTYTSAKKFYLDLESKITIKNYVEEEVEGVKVNTPTLVNEVLGSAFDNACDFDSKVAALNLSEKVVALFNVEPQA